ncbi:hydrolase [Rhodospirillaceae bacterium KN72]|uniref:Hydrolase n=1 Tax=Pacificispira spongiicola TaxID=2729598 RepID=A0A7Y0E2J5_9PROT|nr:hydrolase [Pacificispira spongiicola]NMM46062.1 hydrolase [Pacificispira spongiicola]
MLIECDQSLLFVVDVQERLVPAIFEADRVVANSLRLIEAARMLNIPILCSEQYPKGLGHTVPEVRSRLSNGEIFAKTHFSCARDDVIATAVAATGRRQIVLCGTESHVCVLQSAFGFKGEGYDVFVVEDAVSSRRPESVTSAVRRLSASGIGVVTTEMALFEWIGQAGTEDFKSLRHLFK